MAATAIGAFVYDTNLPYTQQRQQKSASTNTNDTAVAAGNFCRFSTYQTNTIVSCLTDDTTVYGFAQSNIPSSTAEPYTAPWGSVLAPIDVLNTKFVVNLKNSGTVPVIGTAYELVVTSGVPYLDTAATTNAFLRPESLYPGDSESDTNPRYICTVVATRQ